MKALLFSPDAGSRPGHFFAYAVRICQGLADRGVDVTLITTRGFSDTYRSVHGDHPPFIVREIGRTTPRSPHITAKKMRRNTTSEMVRYLWRRVRDGATVLAELRKLLSEQHFDVLHWLDNPEMLVTLRFALATDLRRSPATSWFINVHPADLAFGQHGSHLLRRLYKSFSGWTLRFLLRRGWLTGVFVHGEWIRSRLLANWKENAVGSRVLVAPYGVDRPDRDESERGVTRQELGIPDEAFVALSFGMIRKDKRIDDIITAVSMVKDIWLVIAGLPAEIDSDQIKGWAERAGVCERVVLWLDYVPEECVPKLFAMSDVLILAHDHSFAGHSGPLHLACSHQLPIIASDVSEIGYFVRNNEVGEVFAPRDTLGLANLLSRFRELSAAEYQAYKEREREVASQFSWANTCSMYLDAYRRHL